MRQIIAGPIRAKRKKIIFYIILIIVVLVLVFLSQRIFFREAGKTFVSGATSQVGAYLAKGSNWAISAIYPKISGLSAQAGEAQKRGDAIKNEINQTTQKITDIPKKIENYFSGITNSILHPGENNNCQVQPPQTTAGQ